MLSAEPTIRSAPGHLRQVLGSFFILSAGESVAKLLRFVATIHLARALGATGFGVVGLGATLVGYFGLMVDAGLTQISSREIATDQQRAERLISHVLTLRATLSLVALAMFLAFVGFLPEGGGDRYTLRLFGLMLCSGSLMADWAFVPLGRSRMATLGSVSANLGYSLGILLAVRSTGQLALVPVVQFASETLAALLVLAVARQVGLTLKPRIDLAAWKELLRQSAPLAGASLMRTICYSFDVLLIGITLGYAPVGFYLAAYKVILFVISFAGLYQQAFLPGLTQAMREGPESAERMIRQSVALHLRVMLPISLAGIILAPHMLRIVYGSGFEASVLPLQILLVSLVCTVLHGTYKYALVANNRQDAYLRLSGLSAAFNVGANLILIPRFGLPGAAAATLLSETVILAASSLTVKRLFVRTHRP